MSKITDNEDTHSPDKSEMTNYESHDHGERHHGERYHGERHHGGQEVGVVARKGSMNEAAQMNPGEHNRNADELSKTAAKHALPPIPQTERRTPVSTTQNLPYGARESVSGASRETISGPPGSRPLVRQVPSEVRRSTQDRSMFSLDFFSPTQPKSRYEMRLEKDCRDLQENYADISKAYNNLRHQINDQQHDHQAQNSKTEGYIQGMKDRETKLTEKIHELEMEKNMYEYEIQQSQIKSFRNMKQGRWLPLEESSVQGKLELLQSSIKQWAKFYAVKNMSEVGSIFKQKPAEQKALLGSLGTVVRLVDGDLPRQLSEGRQAPFLCLNALLANAIYMHILADPFFFLEDDISPIIDSLPTDSSILKQRPSPNILYRGMYENLMTVNKREAHLWRSQMLRILSPSIQDDAPPGEKRVKHDTEALRQKVCSRHAAAFLEGPARHLLQAVPTDAISDRLQRVETIFQTAGKLSYQLWTQVTYFECRGLQDLKNETFSIDSAVMEVHPLVHLDEAPARVNERPITMVVNPLVQVWGTDEAEGYEQCRVWAKAVVWLPLEP